MGAGWLAVEIGFIFTKIHSELQINTLGRERESRPSFVGGTNETLAEDSPVGVGKMVLHGLVTEDVGHVTSGQLTRSAFFQRTLNSSKL